MCGLLGNVKQNVKARGDAITLRVKTCWPIRRLNKSGDGSLVKKVQQEQWCSHMFTLTMKLRYF